MSILIKGIKVHRGDCWECPCLDGEYGECNVFEKDVHYVDKADCPIIELPDHGDLASIETVKKEIDRFIGYLDEDMILRIKLALSKLPVLIPAERSEE